MNIVLTPEEAASLAALLQQLVIRDRTGELGIVHGADRFVGTSLCLKKNDRKLLHSAAAKLGLKDGIRTVT